MIKKSTIANCIFTITLLYIISPWFFERKLLFNEILVAIAILLFTYKRFRVGNDKISIYMLLLLTWGGVHLITSLFRMDSLYYYLRNSVIVYSMSTFFIGYYFLKYLKGYIDKIRTLLRSYIGIFLFIPLPRYLFERFGMSMLFPALFKKAGTYVPFILLLINIIYGFTYDSLTALTLSAFYLLLFISPGYKFFSQVIALGFIVFAGFFIYLHPNLELIGNRYSPYNHIGIFDVIHSHPILSIDGNSTWRLVLWNQIIFDNFPTNIFGLGFGTPAIRYYPVEDYSKLSTLPYVLGAHNSFVYLFGRLGIIYVLLITPIYIKIFKEYFYYKSYYYSNKQIFIFWSFFAATMIALFNPALESPIYASGYWMLLGFVARAIHNRIYLPQNISPATR